MVCEKCVKCGNDGAFLEYFGHKAEVERVAQVGGSVEIVANTTLSNKEVLKVTCRKCLFSWFDKPLDVQNRGDYNV